MPSQLEHRRTHNLLLVAKLLNCRDNASPLTLVVDSLEQSAKPVIRELIRRANVADTRAAYVAFETLCPPSGVDVFINASQFTTTALQQRLDKELGIQTSRTIIIFDTLQPLMSDSTASLPQFLSSLSSPQTSIIAVYHSDVPLPGHRNRLNPYSPSPLTLVSYLATTIITTHSLSHMLAQRAAADRSLASPLYGLEEGREGLLQGVGSNDSRGVVLEIEFRRKSGRSVGEWYFLPFSSTSDVASVKGPMKESIMLLEDHPLWRRKAETGSESKDGEDVNVTFNLGLTEKQRRDREGVVLPYFDAQRDEGIGQGGRILYDMGEEDDFDEEEDEI